MIIFRSLYLLRKQHYYNLKIGRRREILLAFFILFFLYFTGGIRNRAQRTNRVLKKSPLAKKFVNRRCITSVRTYLDQLSR